MDKSSKLPVELENLAEQVGNIICHWGFKKVHGRIWTHLYLSDSPLDAAQLMERLRVSKALISLSLNDLLRQSVIVEAGKSARGTLTYIANPNVLDVIRRVLVNREQKMLAQAENCFKALTQVDSQELSGAGVKPHRLEGMQAMIEQASLTLATFLTLGAADFKGWLCLNDEQMR